MTHLTLSLLDGTHLKLAYPDDLDMTSHGAEVQTMASLDRRHSRLVQAHYGSPESFITRAEQWHGNSELVTTYPGVNDQIVEVWGFALDSLQYLVYDFDPWTVYVWDDETEPMDEVAQTQWAASLWGETYFPGFLVLHAEPPLQLVDAAEDPGPDGPDIRIDGSSGSLLVFVNDCDRIDRLDEEGYGDEIFAFCDQSTNTLFFVGGDAQVQQRLHEELVVDPLLPGVSDQQPPILAEETGSQVYFSNDFELTVVNVDAGAVTVHETPELAPGDPLYRLARRGDKLVFYGHTDTGPAVHTADPANLGEPEPLADNAWFFLPSAVDDRVWVVGGTPDRVREITVESVPVPDRGWLAAAVDDGLVFQGDGALEIWDPETQELVVTLPGPFPVATWRNRIVTCDLCDRLHLIDLDTSSHRTIEIPVGVAWVDGYGGAFSPDGRYVAVLGFLTPGLVTFETEVVTVLVDFEAGTASIVPGSLTENRFSYPKVAWNSDGEWLFIGPVPEASGDSHLLAYRPGDTIAYRVPATLANDYYGMAAD